MTIDLRPAPTRSTPSSTGSTRGTASASGLPRPRQHPPRAAAREQRRRDPRPAPVSAHSAPRHGDRHLGAAGRAGAPGQRGEQGTIYPGLAQRMSAGSGIPPLEVNAKRPRPEVHLVQMWVLPDHPGHRPRLRAARPHGGDRRRRSRRGRLGPGPRGRGHHPPARRARCSSAVSARARRSPCPPRRTCTCSCRSAPRPWPDHALATGDAAGRTDAGDSTRRRLGRRRVLGG